MEFKNILTTTTDGILTITINREDKLNALNKLTIEEIGVAIKQGAQDKQVHGMIITGAGRKAFVAGADISEFSSHTTEEGTALSAHGHRVFDSIEACTKPVIAAVNGFALGGGCELAMACHLRVAADNARFGQPEVKLGLIPGYGGTQRLPQLIGKSKALELLMTADMIDAEEALHLGLVNYVTTPDELLGKCNELLAKIALQSPAGVAGVIKCVNAYYQSHRSGFEFEIKSFGECFDTGDFKEGTAAFLEKRKPAFERS